MLKFPVIDTHLHLWDITNSFCPPWLSEYPGLNKTFSLNEYNNTVEGISIEAMVFVECEVGRSNAFMEAQWVSRLAEQDNRIKSIVARAPLEDGEEARASLELLKKIRLVKGIRRLIQFEQDPDFCIQDNFIKGIKLLAEYNYSFDICIAHDQLANTIEMVKQCPDTVFILDHIGKPDIKNHRYQLWKDELKILSGFPQVVCKMSGLVTEADHISWKAEDLQPYIEHVIECFGFECLVFGGDWPVVTMAADYRRWFDVLLRCLDGSSKEEKDKLFYSNAKRVYKME